jgi:hypothetical protein
MSYNEYREKVRAEALKQLQDKSWFRGLCTTSIPESWRDGESIEEAALQVVLETALHDRPGGLFGDCGDGLGLTDE